MTVAQLSRPQFNRIKALHALEGTTSHTIERDDPHDAHIFVSLYRSGESATPGAFIGEHVIDADGTCCDGQC